MSRPAVPAEPSAAPLVPIPNWQNFQSLNRKVARDDEWPVSRALGTAMGRKDTSSSRYNCCWIETALHALSDPMTRLILERLANHLTAATLPKERVPLGRQSDYENGRLVALVLTWRMQHLKPVTTTTMTHSLKTVQQEWNDKHEEFMSELRLRFPTLSDAAADYMGDPNELIVQALCGLRTFFYYNWGDGPVIQWYLGYHHRVILQSTRRCTGCSVWTRTTYDHREEFSKIDVLSGRVLMLGISVQGRRSSLEEVLAAALNTDWYPCVGVSCPDCHAKGGVIQRIRLVNLPLFLMVPIQRPRGAGAVECRLSYNADRLTVGPTIDGMSAEYQLCSRINYVGAHYTIDQRTSKIDQPVKMMRWNFSSTMIVAEQTTDATSHMLVWRRLPQLPATV